MKQYKYRNRIYTVTNCTNEDIPSHIERVSSYWLTSNVNVKEQTELLETCVKEGIAIKLVNDKNITQCAIYCLHLKEGEVKSHLLWTKSKKLFTMLAWYLRTHLDIAKIFFMPHNNTYIPFEFMVTPQSIRRFHSHNAPLVIDLFSSVNYELGYALIRDNIVQEL